MSKANAQQSLETAPPPQERRQGESPLSLCACTDTRTHIRLSTQKPVGDVSMREERENIEYIYYICMTYIIYSYLLLYIIYL